MKDDGYKEELRKTAERTEAKLSRLLNERADLDKEIARVKKYLINTLRMIQGTHRPQLDKRQAKILSEQAQSGLKEVCLEVLQGAYEPLTATEIVTELKERGFPIDDYRKPLAVISTTLKRLVKDQKIIEEDKEGRNAYRWNPDTTRQLGLLDHVRPSRR